MALLAAAKEGDVDRVLDLVQDGSDINARDDDGFTPLLLAMKHSHDDTVAALLSIGADEPPESKAARRKADKAAAKAAKEKKLKAKRKEEEKIAAERRMKHQRSVRELKRMSDKHISKGAPEAAGPQAGTRRHMLDPADLAKLSKLVHSDEVAGGGDGGGPEAAEGDNGEVTCAECETEGNLLNGDACAKCGTTFPAERRAAMRKAPAPLPLDDEWPHKRPLRFRNGDFFIKLRPHVRTHWDNDTQVTENVFLFECAWQQSGATTAARWVSDLSGFSLGALSKILDAKKWDVFRSNKVVVPAFPLRNGPAAKKVQRQASLRRSQSSRRSRGLRVASRRHLPVKEPAMDEYVIAVQSWLGKVVDLAAANDKKKRGDQHPIFPVCFDVHFDVSEHVNRLAGEPEKKSTMSQGSDGGFSSASFGSASFGSAGFSEQPQEDEQASELGDGGSVASGSVVGSGADHRPLTRGRRRPPDTPPVEVDAKTNAGWTALHFAAQLGHTATATLLLQNQADVNEATYAGAAALALAAEQGRAETARVLVEAGAEVNARDFDGVTALMASAKEGRTEIVEMLISKHADLTAANDAGKTARDFAARRRDIIDILDKPEQHTEIGKQLGLTASLKKYQKLFWQQQFTALSDLSGISDADLKDELKIATAKDRKLILKLAEKRPSWRFSVRLAALLPSTQAA